MSEEKEKTLSRLIEQFRERLDELGGEDLDEETREALVNIDRTLGLIERAVADFKIRVEALVE